MKRQRTLNPTIEQKIVYDEIYDIIANNMGVIGPQAMLAILANFAGKLIGMQDFTRLTLRDALEIVKQNIKIGNQEYCENEASNEGAVH